jgi:hypothetical protein
MKKSKMIFLGTEVQSISLSMGQFNWLNVNKVENGFFKNIQIELSTDNLKELASFINQETFIREEV